MIFLQALDFAGRYVCIVSDCRRQIYGKSDTAQLLRNGLSQRIRRLFVRALRSVQNAFRPQRLCNRRIAAALLLYAQEHRNTALRCLGIALGIAQHILNLRFSLQALSCVQHTANRTLFYRFLCRRAGANNLLGLRQRLRRHEHHLIQLLLQGHRVQQLVGTLLRCRERLCFRLFRLLLCVIGCAHQKFCTCRCPIRMKLNISDGCRAQYNARHNWDQQQISLLHFGTSCGFSRISIPYLSKDFYRF